jgi:tRNA(fMet)-specific endonuclease VapC
VISLDEPVLLDSNVLVHLIRGTSAGQRIANDHQLLQRTERPLISIVTAGELKALALKLGWGSTKQRQLDELIAELVVVNLHQGNITQRYAAIDFYCEKVMKPARLIGQNDLWIAATAAVADAHLLTMDRDFDHLSPQFIKLVRIDRATGATL